MRFLLASMRYSLLLEEIFPIPAGKSLLVKNPDLLIKVVAASAFSSLLDTPLSQHLSQPVVSVICQFSSLTGLPTIGEAISYLRVLSIQHNVYLACCGYSNAGVLNFGPVELWGWIFSVVGECPVVLCIVGSSAASLISIH